MDDLEKIKSVLDTALRQAEEYQGSDEQEAAERCVRMASTAQRMYMDALRHADDATAGRQPVTVFWDESLTDDFILKFLGPCPFAVDAAE